MPGPPDMNAPGACGAEPYKYDYVQAERILRAMDCLRIEAQATDTGEIVTMIDAAFNLLVTAYYSILRYEMKKLAGNELVQ
jgi:hypothetical protein